MRPQLMRYAMLRLRNRERAEDAVHETLLAALEGVERFCGASSLRTWVGGILKHKIADCQRRAGREELTDVDLDLELPDSDPEIHLVRRRFFESVEDALRRLPANAARVFMLREVFGHEPREVCAQLGMSPSNCWVTLHRAKARLRALTPHEI